MSTFPVANAISTAANQGVGKQALEDFLAATKQIPGAGVAETTLTLSANVSGTITPTQGIHQVDTASSAATGDLANILQTNLDDGNLLMIRSVNAGRTVVVKHSAGGAGQISLINGVDLSLDDPSQYLLLKRTGALWQEVSYFTLSTGTGKLVRQTSPILTSPTVSGALTQTVGANVASASTINLTAVAGNACHVTGTTTITAVTLATGKFCEVIFDGALTLTHHATNNNLPGAATITTAVGDRALYWSDGTTVYCLRYTKADGTAVVRGLQSGNPTSDLSGGARTMGSVYQNTSGKFRLALISCYGPAPGAVSWEIDVGSTSPPGKWLDLTGESEASGSSRMRHAVMVPIPNGWYYGIQNGAGATLDHWFEVDL